MEIQQVFVKYIFAPFLVLISTVFLSILNKKNALLSNKKLIIGVLLSGVALALPGVFGLLNFEFIPWGYVFTMIYSLVLGILAVYLVAQVDPKLLEEGKVFLFFTGLVIVVLGIYLFQLVFNWFSILELGIWAGVEIVIFIIPLLFWWAYMALLSIPVEINKVWRYPSQATDINLDHLDFDKLLVLELELYKSIKDFEPLKVKVKAPAGMEFGTWFQKFIDDYNSKFPNSPVVYKDQSSNAYNWTFYIKKSFFQRHHYIDPDLDIEKNRITEKMTIHAKRVHEN